MFLVPEIFPGVRILISRTDAIPMFRRVTRARADRVVIPFLQRSFERANHDGLDHNLLIFFLYSRNFAIAITFLFIRHASRLIIRALIEAGFFVAEKLSRLQIESLFQDTEVVSAQYVIDESGIVQNYAVGMLRSGRNRKNDINHRLTRASMYYFYHRAFQM